MLIERLCLKGIKERSHGMMVVGHPIASSGLHLCMHRAVHTTPQSQMHNHTYEHMTYTQTETCYKVYNMQFRKVKYILNDCFKATFLKY